MNFLEGMAHPNQYAAEVREAQLTKELEKVTKGWTQPLVMRAYDSNDKGEARFATEASAEVEPVEGVVIA